MLNLEIIKTYKINSFQELYLLFKKMRLTVIFQISIDMVNIVMVFAHNKTFHTY